MAAAQRLQTAVRAAAPGPAGSEDIAEMIALPAGTGISDADFKTAMRQIASSVAIVTARHGEVRNGLTATAVCSVTATPPTMLVCVNREASAEKLIRASGAFAINFLADAQHKVARLFSTSKLAPEDRFTDARWLTLKTGSPVLDNSIASFDCEVDSCITAGSHNVYFGRIVAVTSLDQDGLLYRDGLFRRLEAAE